LAGIFTFVFLYTIEMKQERKFFTKIRETIPMPNLIDIQRNSYNWLFEKGLKELFDEISPVRDFINRDLELYFLDYALDKPKFDEVTARTKNITYEASLRVKTKLINKKTREVKEQEVYLGDFPLMTQRGTLVINGIERVVVSQLIRSPGIFFMAEIIGGKKYYKAKVIPNRGAWLEFETDQKNVIWVRIDRKRKVAATSLLRAFGYGSDEELLNLFESVDQGESEYIKNTIAKDNASSQDEGLIEVYKRIRPGDLATVDNAKSLIYAMFFNFDRYDFGKTGRYKINQRLGVDFKNTKMGRVLQKEDLIATIREIIRLNNTQENPDDIDHLANRRIRGIGELLQNRLRVGLARMERIIKDRMSTLNIKTITPGQLINARPVDGIIKEFFMTSQLSQFMDQTNPLAELEHKRRLSVLGPGGLSRERAGFEIRDVHTTYYGRICPIATPEGPNIGLVGHLASYAQTDEFGFLRTPYRKVINKIKNKADLTRGKIVGRDIYKKGKELVIHKGEEINDKIAKELEKLELETIPIKPLATTEVVYLDANEEEKAITTPATTKLDEKGYLIESKIEARIQGRPGFALAEDVDFMDVSTKQIISISPALIPFLEHDDAVRALMGTNMQRQAVPCVRPSAPLVGTGVERRAAFDSGHLIIAEEDGKIMGVEASEIKVANNKGQIKIYKLNKFIRSNASTCLNQKPIVNKGQLVKKGDVLADGPSMENGELALGQNLLVAFMSWEGLNYEDAIIVSDRVLKKDYLTSTYIETYSVNVRETKLGPEIITRDIPNISEERLKDLDEDGIIRIGAEVFSGDILVGKITPKGETELSAEEKLLRAIFGEKAKDVRDSSLYLKHGEHGKVIDVKVFSRDKGDKLATGIIKTVQVTIAALRRVQVGDKLSGRHGNKGIISKIVSAENMPFLEDGTPVDILLNPLGVTSRMNLGQLLETHLGLAAKTLGYKVAVPVFCKLGEETIRQELVKSGFPENGKVKLFDGRTGEAFQEKITIGYIYILKLNHMVDDKIHQRSTGPYSLITQQPLGGKAQSGGQRFGEMEVWALEGYGAAHTLQEMLTIKSDDVPGRAKAYESIVKGEPIQKIGLPESFNILIRELNGLCLNIELLRNGKKIKIDQNPK